MKTVQFGSHSNVTIINAGVSNLPLGITLELQSKTNLKLKLLKLAVYISVGCTALPIPKEVRGMKVNISEPGDAFPMFSGVVKHMYLPVE